MPMNPNVKTLIVDDSNADTALISAKLRHTTFGRFDVVAVSDFAAALRRLQSEEFDIVLLDLLLPGVQGLDGLQRLLETYPDTPVIVLTGVADDDVGIDAIRMGAQDYLVKQYYHHHGIIRRVLYAVERHRLAHCKQATA